MVRTYIKVIRQDSPEAAAVVEQIQALAGSRAALRATHIVTLLKMELKQNRYMPDLSIYAYIFRDYPEALPLLEQALDDCLKVWGVENIKVSLKNGNSAYVRS